MFVLTTVSLAAISDSRADICQNCPPTPPPPVDATCPSFNPASPDPLLHTNGRADTTANVGKIADAFSVTSTGEAVYRLALEVPPGRAGMEPHPSLVYDSASGSGLVGMGFSLEGFSSITRCASSVAQDGGLRGVSYDKGDKFCLDGLRLVKLTHVEHSANGPYDEYRTFPDTFRSVRAYYVVGSNADTGPTWLQVFDKSGRILDYGHDLGAHPNGRVMGQNGLVRAWWITQESDRRSNAIQYLYRNETDPVDGHTVTHVPLRINYTAYLGSPARAATNAVVFDAPDVNTYLNGYVGGMEISRRPRLDKIRMLGPNDAPVRSYGLTWDKNALPGRSRISQIVECAEDDPSKCRPPTRLDWLDQPGQGFAAPIDTGIAYGHEPNLDYRFKWLLTDVTGDGLSDVVIARSNPTDLKIVDWTVARNLGGLLAKPVLWQTTETPEMLLSPPDVSGMGGLDWVEHMFDAVPLDYDQDGVTDLLFHAPLGSAISWLRSPAQGDGFTRLATGIVVPTTFTAGYSASSAALYADVDGDGVLDLIQCTGSSGPSGSSWDWQLRRWAPAANGVPAGFGSPEYIHELQGRTCDLDAYMHLVDLDGDGKTELVYPPAKFTPFELVGQQQPGPNCGGPCLYKRLQWNQPPGGGTPYWDVADTGLTAPDRSKGPGRVLFLDVNGDGLPDAVTAGDAAYPGQLVTSINTGKGFLPALPSLLGYPGDQTKYLFFSAALDYNGDGRMDLLLPMQYDTCKSVYGKDTCWVVLQSDPAVPGTFFFVPVNIPFSDELLPGHTFLGFSQPLIPRVADINGDGRADLVMAVNGTLKILLNEGPRDLLHTVTDGMNPLDPGDVGFLPNISIEYGATLDHAKTMGIDPASPDAENETYLPRTDPANGCAYPRTCVVGPKRVVSSYTLNNGQNQARSFSLLYRDGRSHRLGRGFLGFGTVLTIEDGLNAGRAEAYDNVTFDPTFNTYPFAGSLFRAWSWIPELPQKYTPVAFSYTDRTLETRGTYFNAGSFLTYFTQPVETRTRRSEDVYLGMQGTQSMFAFAAAHAASPAGELLDTEDVVADYDDFGNIRVAGRKTANVDDIRSVTRVVTNDPATWLLGEVTSETACSESLGEKKCQVTGRSYNGFGEVETEDRGDPADVETSRKIAIARDVFGNPTLVTADDAFGNHRSACTSYESQGIFPYAFSQIAGQVSRIDFDPTLGIPTAVRDANGLMTVWQHDGLGRTTQETGPDGVMTQLGIQRAKTGGPQQSWYALYTDATIGVSVRGSAELDSKGRVVHSWRPNPGVSVESHGVPPVSGQSGLPYQEDTTYDVYGRVASRSKPWTTLDPGDAQILTQYQYDHLGRMLSVKAPSGYETTYSYSGNTVVATMPAAGSMLASSTTTTNDPLGRPWDVMDARKGHTVTLYGPFGAPETVQTPAGLFVTLRDAYGRVRTEVDPDRGTSTIDYDGFDEQTRIVDAAKREVTYWYDGLGRRTTRLDDGVLSTLWSYDDPLKGYGRLANVETIGGAIQSYAYDPKGRVSSIALHLGGDVFFSSYTYDPAGNVDTVTYPQGPGGAPFRIRNDYDSYNNLIGVHDDLDPAHPSYWHLEAVNGAGQTVRERFGNNAIASGHALVTERDYDVTMGNLKAIHTKMAGAATVQNLGYGYDARLKLTSRVDALQTNGSGALGEHFTYDELDRLKSSSFDFVCAQPGCNAGQALTYAPDGNIATKSDVAGGAPYTYDFANGHPHALAGVGNLSYGYDAVGNQTSRPELTIEYTPFDLPKKYIPSSGLPTTFDYDGDRARVRKTTPSDETVYAGGYERVTHFGMTAPPTEHRYYIRSNERVVAMVTRTSQGAKTAYLHADHLGSTDVITDGTGAALGTVLERRSYDAFGAKRNPAWGGTGPGAWAAKTTVGFTGHESDDDFGLVNMKGRIYDPSVGRFLTTDPVVSHPRFSQSWNPYSYVLNNPLNLVDPSGFDGVAEQNSSSSSAPNPSDPATWVWSSQPDGTNLVDAGFAAEEVLVTGKVLDAAPQGDANMPAGDPGPGSPAVNDGLNVASGLAPQIFSPPGGGPKWFPGIDGPPRVAPGPGPGLPVEAPAPNPGTLPVEVPGASPGPGASIIGEILGGVAVIVTCGIFVSTDSPMPLETVYGAGGAGPGGGRAPLDRIQQATRVADYAKTNGGAAKPGYQGGTPYRNDGRDRTKVLPRVDGKGTPITYLEYDVNRYNPNVDRGSQRVVIGSDGSRYYTGNHYVDFEEF